MKKIAVFASGAGSNAARIVEYFAMPNTRDIEIALIVSNKPGAGVLNVAALHRIPCLIIEKERFFQGDAYITLLKEQGIEFIVLAGFLWKIPLALINAFPERIINIHPALLPKYGGQGMYGRRVHQAVIDNKESESGITIHCVDEIYDHGKIIFQCRCIIPDNTSASDLENRVRLLELEHYPRVIEDFVRKINKL